MMTRSHIGVEPQVPHVFTCEACWVVTLQTPAPEGLTDELLLNVMLEIVVMWYLVLRSFYLKAKQKPILFAK